MTHPGKRTKYSRFNTPGYALFISFRCYKNRKFLMYNRTRRNFIAALDACRSKYRFDIWAYVVMPEHVHLLIWPRFESYSTSDILKSLKLSVSKKSINWLKLNKPDILKFMRTGRIQPEYRFWQDGGGYITNVNSRPIIANIMDYIHMNPVKAGLVERPEDWYWSSAGAWIYDSEKPLKIDMESYPI
jgi:putative transposase